MRRHRLLRAIFIPALLALQIAVAETAPVENPGLTNWKNALISLDSAGLAKLYSATSVPGPDGKTEDVKLDSEFWQQFLSQKPQDIQITVRGTREQQGVDLAALAISFKASTPAGLRSRYLLVQQYWQRQGDAWRIVWAKHTDVLKMPQPTAPNPNLYPKNVNARQEIQDAVARAAGEHKRVILVFGANWCYDCHVLDFALHNTDAAPIAERNFIIVHVDIGDDGKLNSDLAEEYKIPLDKGVPALAVLGEDGKLLYSQQRGEFESARSMDPDDLISFLNRWKPKD